MQSYALTLGELRSELFDIANTCADDDEIITLVNRANQLIHLEDSYTVQEDRICIQVDGSCVTVPFQYESLDSAMVNSRPILIRNRHFEFLLSGAGEASCCGPSCQLHDKGFSPTFKDPSEHSHIFFVSDRTEDAAARIHVKYQDGNGKDFFHNGHEGESLKLVGSSETLKPKPQLSTRLVKHIVQIKKPVTQGYVYSYAYDEVSGDTELLGRYHPSETDPSFRQYLVEGGAAQIVAMARRKLTHVCHDEDLLPVGMSMIYRYYIQALRLEDSRDPQDHQTASIVKNRARKYLNKYMSQGAGIHAGALNYRVDRSPAALTRGNY